MAKKEPPKAWNRNKCSTCGGSGQKPVWGKDAPKGTTENCGRCGGTGYE